MVLVRVSARVVSQRLEQNKRKIKRRRRRKRGVEKRNQPKACQGLG
jgi:hypothetical protein